jgi:hypothetical protein
MRKAQPGRSARPRPASARDCGVRQKGFDRGVRCLAWQRASSGLFHRREVTLAAYRAKFAGFWPALDHFHHHFVTCTRCQITGPSSIRISGVRVQLGRGSADAGSADTIVAGVASGAGDTADAVDYPVPPIFTSNTSRQIYFSQTNTVGAPSASILRNFGWIDRRGQDA